MANEKITLENLFHQNLFEIPDYQRGYAWGKDQWKDFTEDLEDLLNDDSIKWHYTGTLVTFPKPGQESVNYGIETAKKVDVVDGQQRLTTISLFMSALLRILAKRDPEKSDQYRERQNYYLYRGSVPRLRLNNDTQDIYFGLLKNGIAYINAETTHQTRIVEAIQYFDNYLNSLSSEKLEKLYSALITKLSFTHHEIEEEHEIGMTFELMNSRGKELSVLELLKNYFMHWISRNGGDEVERKTLTDAVNDAWKATYKNVGKSRGNEHQFLRTVWTLYCSHQPKKWDGYAGFKRGNHFPLRGFQSPGDKKKIADKLDAFAEALAKSSADYACVLPKDEPTRHDDKVGRSLARLKYIGNVANFLPILVVASGLYREKEISESDFVSIVDNLERYAYRVFLLAGRRSNAGKPALYRYGHELLNGNLSIDDLKSKLVSLTNNYNSQTEFLAFVRTPRNWYHKHRKLLLYTLYEYEQHERDRKGHGQLSPINWKNLEKERSIEHILPQTPKAGSQWLAKWSDDEILRYKHDIGNLVLTLDNARYQNFEFERKKGKENSSGYCYRNSEFRQEQNLKVYDDWTPDTLQKRRDLLAGWIIDRWGTEDTVGTLSEEELEEDAENEEPTE